MMNYMKSEFYRISHDKSIYFFTAILAGLSFLYNIVLNWFGKVNTDFPYNITSHSYSIVVSSPMLYCLMGAIIGNILYAGNRKNGNLKNTVSFGISRIKIFVGECIATLITATIALMIVLPVDIISASLLLEETGPVSLSDLLTEVPAIFLLAVASVISEILYIQIFENDFISIMFWFIIWIILPRILFYLGLYIDTIYRIAMWMPENFLGRNGGMSVNMSQCITTWETTEGMARCIISGIAGIIIFSLSGIISLRKRDL